MDKCPKCGNKVAYTGLDLIECDSAKEVCPNGVWSWRDKLREAVNEKRAEQEGALKESNEDFDPQRSMSALGRALDPQARRTELVKEFIRVVMNSELKKDN